MRIVGALLLVSLATCSASAAEPGRSAVVEHSTSVPSHDWSAEDTTDWSQSWQTQLQDFNLLSDTPDSTGRVCYKIRAYLFRQKDNLAPEYIGSTTCGPGRPRAQDALLPGLSPGDGRQP